MSSVDPREGLFEYSEFKGLRNNVEADAFEAGDLDVALNVDVDDAGVVHRRKGHGVPVLAGSYHSVRSPNNAECFGVTGNTLYQILPDYSLRALRAGLTAGLHLDYVGVGDRTFWSNGAETGVAQGGADRTWGLAVPGVPLAAAVGGSLRAGRYQYAVTYLRSDGQESGAGRAGLIELTDAGGISLTAIPVSADAAVTHKAVYCSAVDGEVLYREGAITNATTTFSISERRRHTLALTTQFLAPAPPSEWLGYYAGRMLAAHAGVLRWSEPYSLELFDLRKGVPVPGRTTMVAPVDDGVWLGTDAQVIWLPGAEPEKFEYKPRADYGAIPGTLAYSMGDLFGLSAGVPVAVFATTRGICVGTPGGGLKNLTEARFQYPAADRGAGVVRRHRGIAQYVTVLQGEALTGEAQFAFRRMEVVSVGALAGEAEFTLGLPTVVATGALT